MKKSIVDHVWHKIADLDSQGRAATVSKLEQVVDLARRLSQTEGEEHTNNILDHGLIEVALLRCREIQDGKDGLCYDDLQIYYRYATSAMKRAEAIIAKELSHLDL